MTDWNKLVSDKMVAAGRKPEDSTGLYYEFEIEFWRESQYSSYEEAKAQGAVYVGEDCHGYTAYADAMTNVRRALECCNGDWQSEGLRVHLTVDKVFIGDLDLWECY